MKFGAEPDPVIRQFGQLYEGLRADSSRTPPELLHVYRDRYSRRLNLADLARMPEGMEFDLSVDGKSFKSVILLSPPELVAILYPNGSWQRVPRVRERHGPAPYSRLWYQRYLSDYNLPTYFLQIGHQDMRVQCAEAEALGFNQTTLQPPMPGPTSRYLNTRYPVAQRAPNTVGAHHTWVHKLSEEEQHALARRFPATNLLGPDRRVLILPDGYICMHHDPIGAATSLPPPVPVPWIPNWNIGSYIVCDGYQGENLTINDTIARKYIRSMLLQDLRAKSGIVVKPMSLPAGRGMWDWLQPDVDAQLAETLGRPSQVDVVLALQHGALASGASESLLPVPVWHPDPRLLNPPKEPNELGSWDFLTVADRTRAQAAFAAWAVANTNMLSALAVWKARQAYRERLTRTTGERDITEGVNLVWVPYQTSRAVPAPLPLDDDDVFQGPPALQLRPAGPAGPPGATHPLPAPPRPQATPRPGFVVSPDLGTDTPTALPHLPRHQPAADPTRGMAGYSYLPERPRPRPGFAELTAQFNRRISEIGARGREPNPGGLQRRFERPAQGYQHAVGPQLVHPALRRVRQEAGVAAGGSRGFEEAERAGSDAARKEEDGGDHAVTKEEDGGSPRVKKEED